MPSQNHQGEGDDEGVDLYGAVFRGATLGMVLSDAAGHVLDSNPALQSMFARSAEQLRQLPLTPLLHPQGSAASHQLNELLACRLDHYHAEEFYERSDGSRFWGHATVSAVCDAKGTLRFVVGMITDISERKELELQLQQAGKMEAVGNLAGGIAHDFNNVLTAISGYTQLILDELPQEDPLRTDVMEVERAAAHAARLVSQLLAFSRKQAVQTRVLDLNATVQELQKMLQPLIGPNIELRTALAKDAGNVRMDSTQIEQVIINLAVNARDAMPTGGKLRINTRKIDIDEEHSWIKQHGIAPGSYVLLTVSDTGGGIPPAIMERVFNPYFTTKEMGKGTGLGLATVHDIVQQNGGYIWLESQMGEGTTFRLCFPRVAETAEIRVDRQAAPRTKVGNATILVVEDEEPVRNLIGRVLRKSGYTVLIASEPSEALQISEQYPDTIHLILTDVIMPGMIGPELAQRIKGRPELKVLFMSGYTDSDLVSNGLIKPGSFTIAKPFANAELISRIDQILREGDPPA